MKYKILEVESYPTLKTGDQFDLNGKTYQVFGYTDAGTRLLVKLSGDYEVFKLVKKQKKEN